MTQLIDKNGNEIAVGEQVIDNRGITGTHVIVSGVHSVKFEDKGKTYYTVISKILPSQIERVAA